MPGIFGFTKSFKHAAMYDVQKAMFSSNLKEDSIYEDRFISASRVHLNKIGDLTSPTSLDGVHSWVEGEVYNLDELYAEFGYSKSDSFSTILIKMYECKKLELFLNKIDGYFCAVIFDSTEQVIKLISDRYGMKLLYWYHNSVNFAWGSEIKGLLAINGVNKAIDKSSFKCFMELGHLLGNNTWFEKIKLMPPASVITFDIKTSEVKSNNYWSWGEIPPSNLSFNEAVDKLGETFIRAVEKRFNPTEKIGITLSGGLDSRVLLAVIDKLYPKYIGHAFTFGVESCDDITIAEKVVTLTSWKHKKYYFTNENWFHSRVDRVWATDGMKDIMHMHGSEFMEDIAKHVDVNLNGFLGDAIFGGSYINKTTFLNEKVTSETAKFFYSDFFEEVVDLNFYSTEHIDPFLFMNRGRRFINMGTVNSLTVLEQRKPFFDNDCVELIYSLPDEYRLNNKLYSAMLQKFFPKFFKDIPWQQTGKPVSELPKYSVVNRVIKKLSIGIKSALRKKLSPKEYTDYKSWILVPEVYKELASILEYNNSEYKELTSDDMLNKYLVNHSLKNDHSKKILRAATVEIYLQNVKAQLSR